MADQIDNDVPRKDWAIDEPHVKTDCHVWTIFPFHCLPSFSFHKDFHEQGAVLIPYQNCALVAVSYSAFTWQDLQLLILPWFLKLIFGL